MAMATATTEIPLARDEADFVPAAGVFDQIEVKVYTIVRSPSRIDAAITR